MRDIIEMAREAGLRNHIAFFSDSDVAAALHRFAELVREQEREKCAEVCEDLHPGLSTSRAAEYIRARSKK